MTILNSNLNIDNMDDFVLIVMTHSFLWKYIKVNKISQRKEKYLVNGHAAALGE